MLEQLQYSKEEKAGGASDNLLFIPTIYRGTLPHWSPPPTLCPPWGPSTLPSPFLAWSYWSLSIGKRMSRTHESLTFRCLPPASSPPFLCFPPCKTGMALLPRTWDLLGGWGIRPCGRQNSQGSEWRGRVANQMLRASGGKEETGMKPNHSCGGPGGAERLDK